MEIKPGQKDKLRYQSLFSQIEGGLKKQYSEAELANAVVRAAQHGLQLESLSDLSLPKLRKILRFHYHEKSAPELYQTLANITQLPKEDPLSFLIRALHDCSTENYICIKGVGTSVSSANLKKT